MSKLKKKIGIITFHHVVNEGAVLQAYAQAKAYQEVLGNEYIVEIIDYRPRVIVRNQIKNLLKSILRWQNPVINIRRYYNIQKFVKSMPFLSQKCLVSDNLEDAIDFVKQKYYAIIAGSDEIWKAPEGKKKRPFPNIYWLPPELNCIKVSSAASANRYDYGNESKTKLEYMEKCLEGFKLVGVRDEYTIDMMKKLNVADNKIYKVPDPTMSLTLDSRVHEKTREKLKKKGLDLSRPALLFAMDSSGTHKGELSKILRNTYKEKGYQVVSMGKDNEYADIYVQDIFSPLEWAHAFKHFTLCVTNKFHGTMFCLKNNIPFLTVDTSERYLTTKRSKTLDLLTDLNMKEHHMSLITETFTEKEIFDRLQLIENKPAFYDLSLLTGRYYDFIHKVKEILHEDDGYG